MITKQDLNQLLDKQFFLYDQYHEMTKNKPNQKFIQIEDYPDEWKKIHYKYYLRNQSVMLPNPRKSFNASLRFVLFNRKSARNFKKNTLSVDVLSNILYYSAGLKNRALPKLSGNRFYPSGGARYPLELYLISNNTELDSGTYHYFPFNHSLEQMKKIKKITFKDYVIHPWAYDASALIIITAIFERSAIKYKERAYRYSLLEAGHLGQNLSLITAALHIKSLALGGIFESKIEELFHLDGLHETIVYAFAIG